MNVVSQDTIFTGRVIMAKDATGKDIDISGSFANKTGDERINFKVANGIDLKDAVNLEQLNEVKDLAFDYVGDTEPTDAIEGDIWLDTSIKSNCIIKIKRLTPTGAQWQDCLGGLKADVNIVLEGFEATLKQYKDEIDKAFSNTDGKYALKYGDLTIPFKVADAVTEGEAVTLRQLLQATLNKANVNTVYDRKTIDGLINGLIPKGSLIGPFNIKGKLTNNELQALPVPLNGDIYFVTDENIWAVRIEGEWLKEQLFNDNKYFTQQQILALLETKADNTTLNNTIREIEQIKQQIGTIDETEVNRLIQAAIVNMVTTDGGQTFTNPIKYDNSVTIDAGTDGKTLVHKEYVDSVIGSGGTVNPYNVYTKQEVDNLLKQYARIDDTVNNEDLNNALKNLFRNRADLVWEGYKASLEEIEAIQNPEVGMVCAIISITKTTPVYMYDGFRWLALSIEEYSKGTTTVVDRPALEESDMPDKGTKMYKIPIPRDGIIQVLGAYVENTNNQSLDAITFTTIIKDNKVIFYTTADAISKLVYITDKGDNNLIDLRNVAKLNMDNHYHNENTYDLPPIILGNATEDNHALNRVTADGRYAQLAADNTFTGNNVFNNAVTGGNATEDNHLLNRVTADGRYSKILVENINWTVGTGGNFSKLSDALSEACKYITINNTYKIVITLKSGYKLNEKIALVNSLASHITITSEDEQVRVDYDPLEDYLFTFTGCIAPQLSCLFNAEGTTAKGIYFLSSYAKMLALNSNKHKFGFINLKKNAVVVENSKVILHSYNLSENGKNLNTAINQDILYATGNGELNLTECKLDNNGSLVNGWLYYCGYNSRLSLVNCSCTNNKSNYNILNNNNSYINAQSSNFTGSRGNYLLRSFNGSQTNLSGVKTASCTWSSAELPFTVNTVTKDGIIYK